MFFSALTISTLIAISSNSWLNSWIGLEINLLSFIPLLSNSKNLMSNESSFKYFLIQALGSSILLFTIIISMMKTFPPFLNSNYLFTIFMTAALLLKVGASPFHFWFPMLVEGMSWFNLLILMSWQKLAPLTMISYMPNSTALMMSALMSAIMGAMGGIAQTSIRKLMAFSSINHLGWMLLAIYFNSLLWVMYFTLYIMILMSATYMFNSMSLSTIPQLMNLPSNPAYLNTIILLNMLSLGGLPPFLGFLPKWLVIQYLSVNGQLLIMTLMVTLSLITLFFYIRLSYTSYLLGHYQNSWSNMSLFLIKTPNLLWAFSFISFAGFFMFSMTSFNL